MHVELYLHDFRCTKRWPGITVVEPMFGLPISKYSNLPRTFSGFSILQFLFFHKKKGFVFIFGVTKPVGSNSSLDILI